MKSLLEKLLQNRRITAKIIIKKNIEGTKTKRWGRLSHRDSLKHKLNTSFSEELEKSGLDVDERSCFYKKAFKQREEIIALLPLKDQAAQLCDIRICLECDGNEEVTEVGEDYLDYCESCQTVEGNVADLTGYNYEREEYINEETGDIYDDSFDLIGNIAKGGL